MPENTYLLSTALEKLRDYQKSGRPFRLAFLDIDGTWAGSPVQEQAVHELLKKNHYVIGQATSRTEGLLDPDILISASGTRLLIKQHDGSYQEEKMYAQRLPKSPAAWYKKVDTLLMLSQSSPASVFHLPAPYCRVEVTLASPTAADQMIIQLQQLDSKSEFNFARETKNFFITPAHVSKADGVDYVMTKLLNELKVLPEAFFVLLAGDTAVEIPLGFLSAPGTNATFIIPGGAPLYQELRAGIFPGLSHEMTKTQNGDTLPAGVYWLPKAARRIVLGDEAFPGTEGPETLIAWLRENT